MKDMFAYLKTPNVKNANFTMQALSKRIHYGKFVAEEYFQASPDDYELFSVLHFQLAKVFSVAFPISQSF